MSNGKTVKWKYTLLHSLTPEVRKTVLDSMRNKGRCKAMGTNNWNAFRARLEAPTWIPTSDEA